MELAILFDHHFYRTAGQIVYSPTSYSYCFFKNRYLSVFDNVSIVSRVTDVPPGMVHAHVSSEGPGVKILDLGDWTGAWGFLKSRQAIVAATKRFMARGAAFILIAPGGVASLAFRHLVRNGYPLGLEVVGDPWDGYSPGATRHPLRPIIRRWSARYLRRQCELAAGALYVTNHALQQRYPCAGLTAGVSDVVLSPESFASAPRSFDTKTLTAITVGSMAQMYKGQDLLIDAVQICVQRGLDLRLTVIGGGRHRSELERRAQSAGIGSRVRFTGELSPAAAVRAELDQADLCVLASRQEGLPRALVEAMARALPCIGTRVGGIPELLQSDDLVVPRDASALASRISEVACDRERMAHMSLRNLRKAAEYREEVTVAARADFYRSFREITRERLAGRLEVQRNRACHWRPSPRPREMFRDRTPVTLDNVSITTRGDGRSEQL